MFSPLNSVHSIFTGSLLTVILGLGAWSWYQSRCILQLEATNHHQAQTLSHQQQVNQLLVAALSQERQAVENQQKIATALQRKVEIAQREIKSILAKDACANTALPVGITDTIKRLQHKDAYQD